MKVKTKIVIVLVASFVTVITVICAVTYTTNIRINHDYFLYEATFKKMRSIQSKIIEYEENCGEVPSDLAIDKFIALKECPDGTLLTPQKRIKDLDRWGNPFLIKKVEGEISLMSCGAEWIEIKLSERPGFINSIYNNGGLVPFSRESD